MNKIIPFLLLLLVIVSPLCSSIPSDSDDVVLVSQFRESLENDLLNIWYPRVVDKEDGGYLSSFDADWVPLAVQDKMIVTQARHVWTSIRMFEFFPEKEFLKDVATHGVKFLQDKMWDHENGGFFQMVSKKGQPIEERSSGFNKTSYGCAFAIYALSAYYDVTGDKEALALAQKAFFWLEEHAHDDRDLGYFNSLTLEGTAITESHAMSFPKGQNTSIHLLEAFTELYHVWQDPLLKSRLAEMHDLILNKMMDDRGFVRLYFDREWNHVLLENLEIPADFPMSKDVELSEANTKRMLYHFDHVSFGHDVEIAFLMLEAKEALGSPEDEETLIWGKHILDHSLEHGWDDATAGLFDGAYYRDGKCEIVMGAKCWWAQAELLNTLLIMAEHFPHDSQNYHQKAVAQWDYIKAYLIDQERGGWYEESMDRSPKVGVRLKAHIWKGVYHDGRALMNVIHTLTGE